MSSPIGSHEPLRDPHADLDLAEQVLARVLLLPRRVPKAVQDEALRLRQAIKDPRQDPPCEALTRFLDEKFGAPHEELRRLFGVRANGRVSDSHQILRFLEAYQKPRRHFEPLVEDHSFAMVESWIATPGHAKYRRMLIDSLIAVRAGAWKAIKARPNPDDPEVLAPSRVVWGRTPEGHVEVRLGGVVRRIEEERLAWIFAEVANAHGVELTWTELLARRASYRLETAGIVDVENVQESSFERYGRTIREQLCPLGDLWEQSGSGARWTGDEPLTS